MEQQCSYRYGCFVVIAADKREVVEKIKIKIKKW